MKHPPIQTIEGIWKGSEDYVGAGPLRKHDARKGQEKDKVVFRGSECLKPDFQVIDFKGRIGRGEWIRTTDLLVPNQAL